MSEIKLDTNISAAKAEKTPDTKTDEKSIVKNIIGHSTQNVGAPEVWIPGQIRAPAAMRDYNEVNILEGDDVKAAKLEHWMGGAIGKALMAIYPNRQWGVGVNIEGGMIYVMCPSVSTTKAYYISMVGRTLADLVEEAKRAAGEILERHNLSRSLKFDPEVFEHLDRDLKDDVISPDAAPGQEVKRLEQ